MEIEEFAENWVNADKKAFQEGNFEALQKLEDPGVVYHDMIFGQEYNGFEAHKQYITGARQSASGLKQEWQYLTGGGDYFALSYKATSRLTAEIPGVPIPKGKQTTIQALFLVRLERDKVAEVWYNGNLTVSD